MFFFPLWEKICYNNISFGGTKRDLHTIAYFSNVSSHLAPNEEKQIIFLHRKYSTSDFLLLLTSFFCLHSKHRSPFVSISSDSALKWPGKLWHTQVLGVFSLMGCHTCTNLFYTPEVIASTQYPLYMTWSLVFFSFNV